MNNMGEFRRYAKLPLIPLVITPEDEGVQDSTPLIEGMEERFPEPGIHPPDPVSRFVSALIEEYADEWANKPMFHYRWTYEADQQSAAERIVGDHLPGSGADDIAKAVEAIKRRMIPRLSFVGSCEATREGIERSYERLLGVVEEPVAFCSASARRLPISAFTRSSISAGPIPLRGR